MVDSFRGPQIIPHLEFDLDYTPFHVSWVPYSTRFLVCGSRSTGEGVLTVLSFTKENSIEKLAEFHSKNSLKSGTFGASQLHQRNYVTGDFGGGIKSWDLERSEIVFKIDDAHSDLINALDGAGSQGLKSGEGPAEVATASRDGSVKVWDLRIKDRAVVEIGPKEGEGRKDAWAVAFGNSHSAQDRSLACGYNNGDLNIVDLRKLKVVFTDRLTQGISGLQYDDKRSQNGNLLSCGLKGTFGLWKSGDQRVEKMENVESSSKATTIWNASFLPQNPRVFSLSTGGGMLTLMQCHNNNNQEGPRASFINERQLSDQPLNCVSWSPDKTGLGLATSFDQKVRLFVTTRLENVL